MLLSEAFDLYENDYIRMSNQSPRTLEMHQYVKKIFCSYTDDVDVEKLTIKEISDWKKDLERDRSQNTVRLFVMKLRNVISYLNKRGIDTINVDLIPLPKRQETVPVFLTEEEVALMIEQASNLRNKFVISLLYASGIRLSELISLNRGQIVEKRFTVIGKGGKPRLCFIDDRTEKLMEEYLARRKDNDSALVVSYNFKERMTKTNIELLVRNTASKAGLTKKVTPHTLRHSYATNFLRNNGNMRYLSYSLGHASMDTTAMYAHVVDYDLERQYQQFHTI